MKCVSIGEFVAGFGDIYRVADIWNGDTLNVAEVQLENISGDAWAFQWITWDDLEKHFEEVERV
jgi:hypothetical protein